MHEPEGGVWKLLFIHLLRMLDTLPGAKLNELDSRCVLYIAQTYYTEALHRFRQVPPFGHDSIRRMVTNRSELKKLACRDYEDMLQV